MADLRRRFGGIWALNGVSFTVARGETVGVIGPNGSGKTTLINTVNGVYRPDAGTVRLNGRSVVSLPPHRLVALGVSRTFQTPRVFQTLTVRQNLRLPTLEGVSVRAEELAARERELLDLVGLVGSEERVASELSGGQQKLLEFARAMITSPQLVLMDEPFGGVHPAVKERMQAAIRRWRAQGVAFLIVSHEIPELFGLCDTVICLAQGAIIAAGTPQEVSRDERVIHAYLGRSAKVVHADG